MARSEKERALAYDWVERFTAAALCLELAAGERLTTPVGCVVWIETSENDEGGTNSTRFTYMDKLTLCGLQVELTGETARVLWVSNRDYKTYAPKLRAGDENFEILIWAVTDLETTNAEVQRQLAYFYAIVSEVTTPTNYLTKRRRGKRTPGGGWIYSCVVAGPKARRALCVPVEGDETGEPETVDGLRLGDRLYCFESQWGERLVVLRRDTCGLTQLAIHSITLVNDELVPWPTYRKTLIRRMTCFTRRSRRSQCMSSVCCRSRRRSRLSSFHDNRRAVQRRFTYGLPEWEPATCLRYVLEWGEDGKDGKNEAVAKGTRGDGAPSACPDRRAPTAGECARAGDSHNGAGVPGGHSGRRGRAWLLCRRNEPGASARTGKSVDAGQT